MEEASVLISILSGAITGVAVLAGGVWALYRLRMQREHTSNPQVQIEHVIHPYRDGTCLVAFTVQVRNIGKTVVHADAIRFAVRILDSDLDIGLTPHWNEGRPIVEDYDVIRQSNPEDEPGGYMIEPGDHYNELVTTVAPLGCLLIARVTFDGREGDHFRQYVVVST